MRRFLITVEKKIPKKRTRNIGPSRRVSKFNDDYFENIDSEEKAYWLGFWFADGCIFKGKAGGDFRCNLSLDSNDLGHIEKFANAINFDFTLGKIFESKRKNFDTAMSRLQLMSEKMFFDLKRLGCVERKSKVLEPPILDSKYNKAFIRGFFDGDGCSTFWVKKHETGSGMSFVSTKPMLDFIFNEIFIGTEVKGTYVKVTDETYRICYGGYRQIILVLNWIYEDLNEVCLDRKLEKAKEILKIFIWRGEDSFSRKGGSKIQNERLIPIFEKFFGKDEVERIWKESFSGKFSPAAFYEFIQTKVGTGMTFLDKKF